MPGRLPPTATNGRKRPCIVARNKSGLRYRFLQPPILRGPAPPWAAHAMRLRPCRLAHFGSVRDPKKHPLGTLGRVATADGSRGFSTHGLRRPRISPARRVATAEKSSVADRGAHGARTQNAIDGTHVPWFETHGYHRSVATRPKAGFAPRE
jgi:hypothetical protein